MALTLKAKSERGRAEESQKLPATKAATNQTNPQRQHKNAPHPLPDLGQWPPDNEADLAPVLRNPPSKDAHLSGLVEINNREIDVTRVPGGFVRLASRCKITGKVFTVLMMEQEFDCVYQNATTPDSEVCAVLPHGLEHSLSPYGEYLYSGLANPFEDFVLPEGCYLETSAFSRGIWICDEVRSLLEQIDHLFPLRTANENRTGKLYVPCVVYGAEWKRVNRKLTKTMLLHLRSVENITAGHSPQKTLSTRLTVAIDVGLPGRQFGLDDGKSDVSQMYINHSKSRGKHISVNDYRLGNATLSLNGCRQFVAALIFGNTLTSLSINTTP